MNISADLPLRLRLLLTILSCSAALLIIVLPQSSSLFAFLGLAIAVTCFVYPRAAFYILIISMLFSPEVIVGQTAAREITFRMDDVLLLIIIFTWFARIAIYKERLTFPHIPLTTPIILFSAASILSTFIGIVNGKVGFTSGLFFNMKIFEYFVIFFMVINYVKTQKEIKTFILLILIVAFMVNLYALYQVPMGGRVSAPFEGEQGEPNTLGGYLIIIISISLAIFLLRGLGDRTNLLVPLLVLSCAIMMFTQSRGSWIGLVFMSIPFVILSSKRFFFIVGALLLISLLPFIAPESTKERLAGTFQPDPYFHRTERLMGYGLDPSASERVTSYKRGFEKWKKRPIFGYGVTGGGFIDGQFLRVLVETGIIGLAFFIFLLWRMVLFVWDIYQNNYRSNVDPFFTALSLGMLGAIAGLIGHGISASSFIIVRIMEPFWFLMGLVAAYPLIKDEIISA